MGINVNGHNYIAVAIEACHVAGVEVQDVEFVAVCDDHCTVCIVSQKLYVQHSVHVT